MTKILNFYQNSSKLWRFYQSCYPRDAFFALPLNTQATSLFLPNKNFISALPYDLPFLSFDSWKKSSCTMRLRNEIAHIEKRPFLHSRWCVIRGFIVHTLSKLPFFPFSLAAKNRNCRLLEVATAFLCPSLPLIMSIGMCLMCTQIFVSWQKLLAFQEEPVEGLIIYFCSINTRKKTPRAPHRKRIIPLDHLSSFSSS